MTAILWSKTSHPFCMTMSWQMTSYFLKKKWHMDSWLLSRHNFSETKNSLKRSLRRWINGGSHALRIAAAILLGGQKELLIKFWRKGSSRAIARTNTLRWLKTDWTKQPSYREIRSASLTFLSMGWSQFSQASQLARTSNQWWTSLQSSADGTVKCIRALAKLNGNELN